MPIINNFFGPSGVAGRRAARRCPLRRARRCPTSAVLPSGTNTLVEVCNERANTPPLTSCVVCPALQIAGPSGAGYPAGPVAAQTQQFHHQAPSPLRMSHSPQCMCQHTASDQLGCVRGIAGCCAVRRWPLGSNYRCSASAATPSGTLTLLMAHSFQCMC